MMEQKNRSWVEYHHKQALSQAVFRPKRSLVNHLVTLSVIMEES